jgi:hypothetical protein
MNHSKSDLNARGAWSPYISRLGELNVGFEIGEKNGCGTLEWRHICHVFARRPRRSDRS